MRAADMLRYGIWAAVATTAARNRKEYGVPTAWLTHLLGNTVTLLLPDLLGIAATRAPGRKAPHSTLGAIFRVLDLRARQDPRYAVYVTPLALGFILSHPDYSIYHGRWAERTIAGFGADSIPHAWTAYTFTRLMSQSVVTLREELPADSSLVPLVAWAVDHVDALAWVAMLALTLGWETSEYLAHVTELNATGRQPHEINMQWSLPDAVTDSLSNLLGMSVAIAVHHGTEHSRPRQALV